jgi:16S rRNA processing protein RimM
MLEVGRVTKAHGLRGEVVVALITDRVERVAPGSVLYARDRALRVAESRPHQKHHIVAFDGVTTREAADALHGVVLSAEALADENELWVHELIGLNIVTVDGDTIGTIESVQDNPAHDLLVLEGGLLVPVVFVVGRIEGAVVVDLPEGLLDL